jgi:hypothetical protein
MATAPADYRISSEPESETLRKWFRPILEQGSTFCAPNLKTEVAFLRTSTMELPLTINEAEWDNSWICSPWNHYVTYAKEEIARASGRATALVATAFLDGIGTWLKAAQFNKVVMVNNWLLSTNSWPHWDARDLPAVLEALIRRWPDHAVVFRSLNAKESAPLIDAFKSAGGSLIPSRQIWWYEAGSPAVAKSPDFRKDLKLLHRGDLSIVPDEEMAPDDFPALLALYDALYLGKYSRHNPRFTGAWLSHLHAEKLARFTALRDSSGRFVGVEACAVLNGILTSPIVGYDLSLPQSLGLYRRLAALPILEGGRIGLPLNLSAGVGRYKALRGGEAVMEYLGLYDRHLPFSRRLPWKVVGGISRRILAPYVQRRGL